MVVDAHAHVIVPEITGSGRGRPRVFWDEGGQIVEMDGRQIRSAVREFVRIEAILEAESAAGVDHVVLCPWVALLGHDLDPGEAARLCRIQNDALAGLVRAHPDRVSALGTVPLQEISLAVRVLEAVLEAGLRGVEVAASVAGVSLGDDRFLAFWDAAESLGAMVFVHPTARGAGALPDYYLWNPVGNPLETTVAAAHLIMAGVMESHPRLRVLLAHGGGAILSLRGRLRHAHAFQPEARSRLRESPEDSLRRFYFDTVTHDLDLLRALVAFAGSDHVLLGSDYPFDMGLERPAEFVRALELPPEDEEKILGGNALTLLGG